MNYPRDQHERDLGKELAASLGDAGERLERGTLDRQSLVSLVQGPLDRHSSSVVQGAAKHWCDVVEGDFPEVIAPLAVGEEPKKRRGFLWALLLGLGLRKLIQSWVELTVQRTTLQLLETTRAQIDRARWLATQAAFADRLNAVTTGKPLGNVFDELFAAEMAKSFADYRATRIAATEVTRWISLGEQLAQEQVERLTGRRLIRIWHTNRDELVCPICRPLHKTSEREWVHIFPWGPPAHPECRCWKTYQLLGDERSQAA